MNKTIPTEEQQEKLHIGNRDVDFSDLSKRWKNVAEFQHSLAVLKNIYIPDLVKR